MLRHTLETADINQLTCRRCWISFENIDQLIGHLNSHGIIAQAHCQSPKGRFTCRGCGVHFDTTCALHNHIQSCSYDGSYIFDNSEKVAIPLTVHNVDSKITDGKAGESVDCVHNLIQELVNSKSEIIVALWNGLKTFLTLHQDGKISVQDQPKEILNPDIPVNEKEDAVKIKIENTCEKRTCTIQTIKEKKSRNTQTPIFRKKRMNMKTQCNQNFPPDKADTKMPTNEMNSNHVQVLELLSSNQNVPLDKADTEMPANEMNSNHVQVLELLRSKIDINLEAKKDHLTDNNDKSLAFENKEVLDLKYTRLNKKNYSLKKKNSISSDIEKKKKKIQVCSVCDKSIPVCRMEIHMAMHSDKRPFECDQCGKSYKYQKHLTAHHLKAHSKVLAFFCDRCGSGFATKSFLRSHMISQHTEARDKPAKCDICGAGFANKYRLNRHRMKHTGSKPLQCDLCGMRFTQLYNLQQHVKCKHRKEQRFACTQCEKKFVTNYQLKCHILKHSGVRPFACTICTKTFTEKKELRRHMRTVHSMTLDEESLPDLTQVFEELLGTDPMLEHTADDATTSRTSLEAAIFPAQMR